MYIPSEEEILNFVYESNAIEGISEDNPHPLVRDHVSAIDYVIATLQEGSLPTYPNVHRILLASEPKKTPGLYRRGRVRVGVYVAPHPTLVPVLMANHWNAALEGPKQGDIEQWAWDMHFEFESIHPFIDGNGRVGRIGMNALRLWHGLSWITIRAEDREEYYQMITDYRKHSR